MRPDGAGSSGWELVHQQVQHSVYTLCLAGNLGVDDPEVGSVVSV